MKKVLAMALLCAAGLPVCAAGQADTTAPKFSISPMGRILMDAAAYTSNEKKDFPAGFAVPDVRVGVKASYGKWKACVDIGYAFGKIGLKDIYVQHAFDQSNLLRF